MIYKNRRSGYVSELTKVINKIKTCWENNDYSKLGDCDNRLEKIITRVRRVTTQLIDLISKDLKNSDEILEFCTEQKLRVVEIRKSILPQCSEKQSETLQEKYLIETSNLFQKELFTPTSSPSSLPKTRISAHPSERSIFSEKAVEKSYYLDSHCSKSSKYFCSTSHSSKSAKSKACKSLYSSKPSEKRPSALSKSFYSAKGSSSASYLSVSEHRKTAKHAQLATKEVEERAQRQLKVLEQSFEFERRKLKKEVLVSRENATLVEHRNLLNECLPKEVKGRSLSPKPQSPNGFR